MAGVVATLGVLHLYYVGAEVAQHHRRVGPRQDPREVEHLYAFEGKLRGVFHVPSVARVLGGGHNKKMRPFLWLAEETKDPGVDLPRRLRSTRTLPQGGLVPPSPAPRRGRGSRRWCVEGAFDLLVHLSQPEQLGDDLFRDRQGVRMIATPGRVLWNNPGRR